MIGVSSFYRTYTFSAQHLPEHVSACKQRYAFIHKLHRRIRCDGVLKLFHNLLKNCDAIPVKLFPGVPFTMYVSVMHEYDVPVSLRRCL